MPIKTQISVKAIAFGGKFIGKPVGFAKIDIYSTDTSGKLLASGLTNQGLAPNTDGSGVTPFIMGQAYPWGYPVRSELATEFTTEIQLTEPTVLNFVATSVADPSISASCRRLVLPTVPLTGAMAVVIVLPGLLAELTSPTTDSAITVGVATPITANIRMMCGCKIENLFWPAANFMVTAIINSMGKSDSVSLPYVAGQPSTFSYPYTFKHPGTYTLQITATEMNGNLGSTIPVAILVKAANS